MSKAVTSKPFSARKTASDRGLPEGQLGHDLVFRLVTKSLITTGLHLFGHPAFSPAPQPMSRIRGPNSSPGEQATTLQTSNPTLNLAKQPSASATARAGWGIPTSQAAPSGAFRVSP